MTDAKNNKLTISTKLSTSLNTSLSTQLKTSLSTTLSLTSSSCLKPSTLEKTSSFDDRKKKIDETIKFSNDSIEAKKPRINENKSLDTSLKIATPNILTKSSSITKLHIIDKTVINEPLRPATTTTLTTNLNIPKTLSIHAPSSSHLQTTSSQLQKENLYINVLNKAKTLPLTLKASDKVIFDNNANILVDSNYRRDSNATSVKDLFKDLTNTQAYLDMMNDIEKKNENFDEETKKIDDRTLQFLGMPNLRARIMENYDLMKLKNTLINLVASSLLKAPNFKNSNDETRCNILSIVNRIIPQDGEFILKLALYTRKELNIRVTANFLLTLASFYPECRKFLSKYFKHSVVLPSDWIDIAEQYTVLGDTRIKFGSLPSALRRSMVEKFTDFDEYQLAKYNKDKTKSKKPNKGDIKHVKAALKPEAGKEILVGDEGSSFEDKYIKTLKEGLKIQDLVEAEVSVKEECKLLKIDLIARESKEDEKPQRLMTARGRRVNPPKKSNEKPEESVALRFAIDYAYQRVTKKSFINKAWTRPDVKMNSSYPIITLDNKDKTVKIQIDVDASEFVIKVDNVILMRHPHNKHNLQLLKINNLRVSGVGIKLLKLTVESKDKIQMDEHENEEEIVQKTFTLKQLIRQLHISKPLQYVFGLLGKRYPATYEDYLASGLPGIFESEKANKRMRLAIPQTWETQISMRGNKAEVWQELIDNKKLPYMAMLRNLRNMIKAGVDEKHHQWVIKKLQDEGAVINSKQFPIQFFSAYDVIGELETELKDYETWCQNGGGEQETAPTPSRRQKDKSKKFKDMNYDEELLKRYKKAIDNALKVATTYNISPIKGRTLIFVDTNNSVGGIECKTARIGKSKRSIVEISALLGLMFKYSCEDSRLLLYNLPESPINEVQLQEGTILDNMKYVKELKGYNTQNTPTMTQTLVDLISQRIQIDNLVVLTPNPDSFDLKSVLKDFLLKYRVCVNESLLFVLVNLGANEVGLEQTNQTFTHDNDVSISGYSDSILRFVAEKGNQGQLVHVENIDKSYDLPALKSENLNERKKNDMDIDLEIEKPLTIQAQTPQWITTKVFISSTFKDMHSERDILAKIVFPLLKSKLNQRFINVHEVDLRWGITESESTDNKSLDICLRKVLECEFFIGMLGERYGQVATSYKVTKHPQLSWLDTYKVGASITELEIACAAFQKHKNNIDRALEKCFFYFRNDSFINEVPDEHRSNFVSENEEAKQKLNQLKKKIISTSFEVFNGYSAQWLGIDQDGRALLTKLDEFAQRVFNNLLNGISMAYPYGQYSQMDEYSHTTGLHESYIESCSENFVGRQKFLTLSDKLIKEQMSSFNYKNNVPHIMLVEGEPGIGKTSFICTFINQLRDLTTHVFPHIVHACPGSESINQFLKRFSIETIKNYNINISQDTIKETNEFKVLKKVFENILNEINDLITDKFIIIVDSVDAFVDSNGVIDESLSWIPDKIPANITFILSARGNSRVQEALQKRVQSFSKKENLDLKFHYDKITLTELEILEKSELIRQKLNVYNKRLDETGFNNQMKLITGKRDAINPLYLSLACEELRLHSNFDNLNEKLKEIPHKLAALIPYTMERLESDYGSQYVSTAFLALVCSRDGLHENELKDIISLYLLLSEADALNSLSSIGSLVELKKYVNFSQVNISRMKSNSDAKFLSFVQAISETFLQRTSANEVNLSLRSHPVIENCIRSKYTKVNTTIDQMNKIIALYFWLQVDKNLDLNWSTKNTRAFTYLPYHLSIGNCHSDLVNILCDLKFLAAKCYLVLGSQLLEDFDFHSAATTKSNLFAPTVKVNRFLTSSKTAQTNKNTPSSQRFLEYKSFFTANYHILTGSPSLIYQQAMNQPENSAPAVDLKATLNNKPVSFMFEKLKNDNTLSEMLGNELPLTIKDFNSSITSVAISPNGLYVACGTENCDVSLYVIATGALLKKFQGHSGKINDICFVGNDSFCTASNDGLASLWNVSGGYRIKVLDKHNNRAVSGCCAEPNGKCLITTGWDCSIKVWNVTTGEYQGEMKGHGRPINCVAFHPEGNLIATGCWDSCVRVFDVFNRQRKAVFRGHVNSVRSVAYSRNGVYIASAAMDGDVNLWNAGNGSKAGVFRGHSLPVTCLKYSPNTEILVTTSTDKKVKLWPSTPGKCIRVIKDNNVVITSVCFNQKSGKSIAVGYNSGEIRIYDLYSNNFVKFKPHNAFIRRVKFTSDGHYLISAADNATASVTLVSNPLNTTQLLGHGGSVNALDVNKVDLIVTGCEDTLIRVYDLEYDIFNDNSELEDKLKAKIILNNHTSPVTGCAFNPDGTKLVTTSKDATIIIWKCEYKGYKITELLTIPAAHPDWITDCRWSNTADFILTSSNDFTLKVFDATTGKLKSTLTGHSANISSCAFQYGCAVSTCCDGTVKVWSHKGYEITTLHGHQSRVNSCDMFVKLKEEAKKSSNEKKVVTEDTDDDLMEVNGIDWAEEVEKSERTKWEEEKKSTQVNRNDDKVEKLVVATVSDDCSIRIWQPMDSDDILSIEAHNGKVESAALGLNNTLCTASSDNSVKIWNLSNFINKFKAGKIIHEQKLSKDHKAEITSIAINSNATMLLSASRDGMLMVWKCQYTNSKLTNIIYLNEYELHEGPINNIDIIADTNGAIEFVTCSNDRTTKHWQLTYTELNGVSLEAKKTINCQARVSCASNVLIQGSKSEGDNRAIMSFEVSTSQGLSVNFFNPAKKYEKKGGARYMLHYGQKKLLYDAKVIDRDLYVMADKIIKINFNEITKQFKTKDFNEILPFIDENVNPETVENWFTSIALSDKGLIVGDYKGNLYKVDSASNKLKVVKKLHDLRITDMFFYKTKLTTRLITSSQDGTVKIWTEDAEKQIGQYNFNSSITCLKNLNTDINNTQLLIACAEQTGSIHLLRWYDKN